MEHKHLASQKGASWNLHGGDLVKKCAQNQSWVAKLELSMELHKAKGLKSHPNYLLLAAGSLEDQETVSITKPTTRCTTHCRNQRLKVHQPGVLLIGGTMFWEVLVWFCIQLLWNINWCKLWKCLRVGSVGCVTVILCYCAIRSSEHARCTPNLVLAPKNHENHISASSSEQSLYTKFGLVQFLHLSSPPL